MSKVLIDSLIDEINTLLSRPVRSVSRNASPDTMHQREQLKQMRSHLEGLTDDSYVSNLEQQYQALVTRLKGQIYQNTDIKEANNKEMRTGQFKTDKLEILPPPLVSPIVSDLFGAESSLTKETSPMTNGTPEPNSTFVNDRMIASLQQAIQQTLQQVVKESVQKSVQQVVSQTLAVERALMVSEISASLNKIVESQQRSQISQELVSLNQQKQKLNAEISQLESDRSTWMQQFQEFQTTQQEALDRSLRSVDNYVRDQISDSLHQTMQQTMAVTADSVSQTVAQTLQDNLANLSAISTANPVVEAPQEELANKVQEQTDRFLLHLDQMFNATFRSLEQEIQGYQNSISTKLGYMETLEQKGEALISNLIDRIAEQQSSSAGEVASTNILPELPDDIPRRYLETFTEPADENLINALLAGDKFGEAIAEPLIEPLESSTIKVETLEVVTSPSKVEINSDEYGDEFLTSELLASDLEDYAKSAVDNADVSSTEELINSEIDELESILGASSDTLFEESIVEKIQQESLLDLADFDTSIILDPQNAIAARELNPDFDVESATQIIERFDVPLTEIQNSAEESNNLELLASNFPVEAFGESGETIDDLELLEWLEESSNRPNLTTNVLNVSADEDLLLWLNNEDLDRTKLPTQTQPQSLILNNLMSEREILNHSQIAPIPPSEINLDTTEDIQDKPIESRIEQSFNNSLSDQAADSDESLILLTNKNIDDYEFSEWEDSLVNELNFDLKRLDAGTVSDPSISANIDQFIRNTPYRLIDWETEVSQVYPTIIDVSAQETGDKNVANNDRTNEQSEIVVDVVDLELSPFTAVSNEIPEIFDNPDALFDVKEEDEILNRDLAIPFNASSKDRDDAIFAEVIAENAARYSQATPFDTDELNELFVRSPEATNQKLSNLGTETNSELSLDDLDYENDLETLLFGGDRTTELEEEGYGFDLSAEIIQEPINSSKIGFPESMESIEEELDTILQIFAKAEPINPVDPIAPTGFMAIEEVPTVVENHYTNITEDDDWSVVLDQLQSNPVQSVTNKSPNDSSKASELSADEFFASLEYNKLNNFADIIEEISPPSSLVNISNIDLENDSEEEDFLLNEFADSQNNDQSKSQSDVDDNQWDDLLNDLNSFNFNEPLLDDRREQLGLSSVAPVSDTNDNVFDIDSLVLESRSVALIPPPPEKEVYNLDDNWVLGIDFGSTAIRASLLNADTGRVYPLYLDDADEMPCKIVWNADHSLDDPMTKDIRILTKRSQNTGLENDEVALVHFKQFLKLGLPYRGVSTWQPIIQWSDPNQVSLRWLIAALKNLLEQIQTRANHPKLPDVGLILLLKLSGVVFGYPTNWSDTYILNVREAVLKAGLVSQAEQVMAVDQAIAPVLSLLHDQKISQEITLLIDAGAVTTSLCLTKGLSDVKDRSKLHIRSLDYAGLSISQDIVIELFYPHWQLITNPNRHLCNFDHLSLPEIGASAPQQRILLQQYLLSFHLGQQMLELADRVKVTFGEDVGLDSWNEELMGQPLLVLRRELENLILQPFIQRLNRELNTILSNAGILGEDVSQVLLLGSTMHIPLLSRWLSQKLPNAKIDPLATSAVANGLAIAPLYPNLQDVARQQYSDYFLLQEICRLNLTQSINPNQLLQQLQMRGINIKVCRDRILSILQGDLPEGLFPWQEPESAIILEDPTLSHELFAGRLFELETDGTYQPNVTKFQQLRVYLQAIIGNMSQTLNEPLVFPELTAK